MNKLTKEDLYKIIYIAAESTFQRDQFTSITKIGKNNQDIVFEELTPDEVARVCRMGKRTSF